MAHERVRLVYGGGRVGLMGVLADAVLAGGGDVTGVIPDFLMRREVGHAGLGELVVVDSMHQRKQRMFELADGFAVLPGGLGTLDETLEILTWKQLGHHDKPVVLVDVNGYWRPLLALVEAAVSAGFAPAAAAGFYHVVARADEVLPTLRRGPAGASESASGL